jgi:2-keto-3-deoxy-galactonokinase
VSGIPAVAAVDWGTTRLRVWLLDFDGAVRSGLFEAARQNQMIVAEGKAS